MGEPLDFGSYLQSVAERDVDLLLMEEFHVSPTFTVWFAKQVGIGDASFDGAWHSVSDQDGETDLLLRVLSAEERIAILIENKIAAPAQPTQDIRYHLRGVRSKEAGRFDNFVTVICAPQIYLDAIPVNTAYQHRVPYEAIRDWFSQVEGPRAEWRKTIVKEAIEQSRRGYTLIPHAGVTSFHEAYWHTVQQTYPDLIVKRPTPKGSQSSVVTITGSHFPMGVNIYHKVLTGEIDLSFPSTTAAALSGRRTPDWPTTAKIVQTGKSAVLRIAVPVCDFRRSFAEQLEHIHISLQAARLLAQFSHAISSNGKSSNS
ncbi:MAG: PD-(D/E)XK nuclease family protein [Pseudomonadota bacterium]|nr:PD-(D/E)XK nuclease family protein [Pseudomonadota bacterium]